MSSFTAVMPAAQVNYIARCKLPTKWGEFTMHGFEGMDGREHVALTFGKINNGEPTLLRIHSECLTGDSLFSLRCDCGFQLEAALAAIAANGCGALLYLRQEGRGIGLINKIRAYHLQDAGADTVEANEQLGFPADMRDFSIAKSMLEHLGITRACLMTNNPNKIESLQELGIDVVKRIPLEVGRNPYNDDYLNTKAEKLSHLFRQSKQP